MIPAYPCMVSVTQAGILIWIAVCHTHERAAVSINARCAARGVARKCREIIDPEAVEREWWDNQW